MSKEEIIRQILDDGASSKKLAMIESILQDECPEQHTDLPQGFLNVKSACEFLGGISRTTLWKLRKRGLNAYSIGTRVLFKADELIEHIRSLTPRMNCSLEPI